jgi:outer membrane protein OmpA-like peptidoglycan-associated protein
MGITNRISLGIDFSTLFASSPAVPEIKHSKKTRPPGEPHMAYNAKSAGGSAEVSKHPNRPPVLPSSGNTSDDERMMRSLVKKGLSVKVEVQAGDSYPRQVEFTVQRGAGPKVAKWMLTITDMADRTVAALSGDGMPASIIWNGKNKSDKAVRNLNELSYDLVLVDVNNDQETTNGMLEQPEGVVSLGRGAGKIAAGGANKLSPGAIVSGAHSQEEKLAKDKKVAVIYFEPGRAEITSEGSEKVGNAVESMKRYPKAKILLLGFCEPSDEKANALLLSKNRAETVQRYLTSYYKISSSRISIQPKGDKEPVVRAEDERLRNKNRRVEIILQPGNQ